MKDSHGHSHDHGCCGHDHSHGPKPEEHAHADHEHSAHCSHEHHQHDKTRAHAHGHSACCGHDHTHDHESDADAEWTRRFFAYLQAVVLIMIGGVMCYFVASGRIAVYLVGNFKILALAGGVGIIIMGLFNLLMVNKQVDCGHEHGEEGDDCGHDHGDGGPTPIHNHDGSVAGRAVTLLLLSSSLAAAAILTPDRYTTEYLMAKGDAMNANDSGAEQFRKENPALAKAQAAGGLTLARLEQDIPRTKDGNFPLSVVNLHFMASDPEYARLMDGQKVETVGQLVKDPVNPGPGHLRIYTLQVTCCAADARPYAIPVLFAGGDPDFVDSGWYNIAGTVEFVEERAMKVARVKASRLTPTLRPADQRPEF